MIYLITGASHTGKTHYAQLLLEKYKIPYFSIDHLKMGLIRSGKTDLTPLSEESDLTSYLWPVVCEMVKTAIENNQSLIVEGCYIPYDWQRYFQEDYLQSINYCCLIMSEKYIKEHFAEIKQYANVIEKRLEDDVTIEELIADNNVRLSYAKKYNLNYIFIDDNYNLTV